MNPLDLAHRVIDWLVINDYGGDESLLANDFGSRDDLAYSLADLIDDQGISSDDDNVWIWSMYELR